MQAGDWPCGVCAWAECTRGREDYREKDEGGDNGSLDADRAGPGHRGAAGARSTWRLDSEDAASFSRPDRAQAREVALDRRPVYRPKPSSRGAATTTSDRRHHLHQPDAAAKAQTVERVFPYVATCGREWTASHCRRAMCSSSSGGTPSRPSSSRPRAPICSPISRDGSVSGRPARMSPGSGDADVWPIEQQRLLFALLEGVTPFIGVILTESCLMIPNKTVSGLLFSTEEDFQTCQVCHREVCPNRRAPFDAAVWHSLREP